MRLTTRDVHAAEACWAAFVQQLYLTEEKYGTKSGRILSQKGPSSDEVSRWRHHRTWSHDSQETERASHKLCGPADRRGGKNDEMKTTTSRQRQDMTELGSVRGIFSHVCCRVSEEVVKEDTVILLVEIYVLTVELNGKITEILKPVFNLFTV